MKKKVIWIPIAAVVIIILLLLFFAARNSVENSLGADIASVKNSFYEGIPTSSGSLLEAPGAALSARLDAADRILNLAAKYDSVYSEYTGLRTAYNDLMTAMKDRRSLAEIKAADAELGSAVKLCSNALAPLTEGKAADSLQTALSDFADAESNLKTDTDSYNRYVTEFHDDTLTLFGNRIKKLLIPDTLPELWA